MSKECCLIGRWRFVDAGKQVCTTLRFFPALRFFRLLAINLGSQLLQTVAAVVAQGKEFISQRLIDLPIL
ncbi:MAG: hypothetical protein LBI31_01215 [Zoogloeaceae bacterium]|nr:hypothetical protein [Zoogloeaceae bacterium]